MGYTCTMLVRAAPSLISSRNAAFATCQVVVNDDWSSTRYFLPDHLNSTNVVTDASGSPIQVLDYYPYGSTRVSQKFSGSFNEAKQYVGRYTDPETNLSYLQARYYDGSKGEFLSEDPVFLAIGNAGQIQQLMGRDQRDLLSDPQTLNSYSYGNDNPITKSDPTGRIAGVDDLIAFGVGGAVNVGLYSLTTAMTGQRITPGGVSGAFLSGGILGVGIDNAPETGGISIEAAIVAARLGARAGFAGEAVKQGIDVASGNQSAVNWGAVAFSPVQGALNNMLMETTFGSARVPGLSCGQGNWYATGKALATKLSNGTISNVSASSAFKSAMGFQVAGAFKTFGGNLFDSVASARSSGSGQSSRSYGGNAVSSWMGAFNPFQPH